MGTFVNPVVSQANQEPNLDCEKVVTQNVPPVPDLFAMIPKQDGYYISTEINNYVSVSKLN